MTGQPNPTPPPDLDSPKYVVRGVLGPKTLPSHGDGNGGLALATGDRDTRALNGEGVEVHAVRVCPDHGTPLDADQNCGHGHVSEWWRVLVNGRLQYGGRKFSSVEDEAAP